MRSITEGVSRVEGVLFGVGVGLFGVYLVARAVHLPLIQDEANCFWWYVRTGEFVPFLSHTDAANHFLNSFFGWAGNGIFGPEPWALRIGSLLAYLLYVVALWRILCMLRNKLVRWCAFPALIMCPFLHEYFALFRGYGLGMAFFVWALLHFIRCVQRRSTRDATFFALGSVLAVYADLSLLPLCAMLAPVPLMLHMWGRAKGVLRQGTRAMVLALVVPLPAYWFAARFALHLQEKGALYLGSGEGLIRVSVTGLCRALFQPGWPFLPEIIVATAIGILVTAAWMLGRDREWRGPLMVLCALLWTEVALRVALNHLFGVNYPEDRAAFQLLVLFLLAVPFAVDALASVQRQWQWSALALLPIPLTTLANLNLEVAMNNLEQGVPERFIKYAAAKQKALGRPLVVAGGGQLITGWAFGLFAEGEMVNDMEMELFGQSAQDLRVVPYFLMDRPHRDYAIVDSTKRQAMYLLERKTPLNLKMVLDSALADAIDPKDFHNFLELRGDRFKGVMLYVRVSGDLSVDSRSGQVMVVADERDSERRMHWDETDLMHDRAVWNGEAFDVMRRLPANPGVTERYCYLWNVTGAPMKATALRLRVYVLDT